MCSMSVPGMSRENGVDLSFDDLIGMCDGSPWRVLEMLKNVPNPRTLPTVLWELEPTPLGAGEVFLFELASCAGLLAALDNCGELLITSERITTGRLFMNDICQTNSNI